MSDGFFTLARLPEGVTLLLRAALASRRHAQHVPHPAPQGQGRQPLERLLRDRVSRHRAPGSWASPGAASRRSSTWRTTRASTSWWRVAGDDARGAEPGAAPRDATARRSASRSSSTRSWPTCSPTSRSKPRPRTLLAFRLARAFDARAADAGERELQRVLTPDRQVLAVQAPDRRSRSRRWKCLGGNGYVEESAARAPLPRGAAERHLGGQRQRDLPRRRCARSRARREAFDALAAEVAAGGRSRGSTRASRPRARCWRTRTRRSARALRSLETLALCVQASLMRRHARPVGRGGVLRLAAGGPRGGALRRAGARLRSRSRRWWRARRLVGVGAAQRRLCSFLASSSSVELVAQRATNCRAHLVQLLGVEALAQVGEERALARPGCGARSASRTTFSARCHSGVPGAALRELLEQSVHQLVLDEALVGAARASEAVRGRRAPR